MIKMFFIQLHTSVNRDIIVYVLYFGCLAYHVWTSLRSDYYTLKLHKLLASKMAIISLAFCSKI